MKILKLLKHDQTTYIHIKDHPDNYAFIISTLSVTLMAMDSILKNIQLEAFELNFKIKTPYASNLDIIDILCDTNLQYKEKLALVLAYNSYLQNSDTIPTFIEVIDVIDSVKPQPLITPRDINNLPFKPSDDRGGWRTIPGQIGPGGWVTH